MVRNLEDEEWPPYREPDPQVIRGVLIGCMMSWPFWLVLYLVWRWFW